MLAEALAFNQEEAEKLHRKYKEHRAYAKPLAIDLEIEKLAKLVASGKQIIPGIGSVQTAGLVASTGLPALAIGRADTPWVMFRPDYGRTGGQMLSGLEWANGNTARTKVFDLPANSFKTQMRGGRMFWRAMAPHIPPDVRPKRGIENYTLLWEALWEPIAPVDPILMRRIGKSDLYLVVAQWDLTPIERMVMNARLAPRMRQL